MGNIRLYTIIFGFVFVFRLFALGPWIGVPLFSPFQMSVYSVLLGQSHDVPTDEVAAEFGRRVLGYRWMVWVLALVIDGVGFVGMVCLSLKKEVLGRMFWRVWFFVFLLWQAFGAFWLGRTPSSTAVWLAVSAAGPFLLWVYGWQRQWLQERVE